MKLREAANILGVSLDELTAEGLKLTYRKLLLAWDPEKCKDLSAKQKYMLITEAYKKINTILEGKDSFRNDEQHELAAFMRMFMDMVGISETESLSTAAMTFGMMFGSRPSSIDEWSTDEENEYGDDEEEDDEEEELDEEEEDDGNFEDDDVEDEYCGEGEYSAQFEVNWEPPAKVYSNMNLKEEVRKAKARDGSDGLLEEGDKKSKTAKKRAEKRKRQKKDRKQKEKSMSFDEPNGEEDDDGEEEEMENDRGRVRTNGGGETPIHRFQLTSDNIDSVIQQNVLRLKERLFQSIALGKAAEAARLLSFHFANAKEVPEPILQALFASWKKELESGQLLHRCITEKRALLTEYPNDYAKILQINLERVRIAGMILSSTELTLDYNATDESGLSILHKSIVVEDNDYVHLIIQFILSTMETNRRINLNLNSRCHKKGWAPIHYAVERKNRVALKLLAEAGANLSVTAATDKKLTPMELAKLKLKMTQGNDVKTKTDYQLICEELSELLLIQKKEKQKKVTPNPTSTATAAVAADSSAAIPVEESPAQNTDESPPLDPVPVATVATNATTNATSATNEKKKKKKKGNNATEVSATSTVPAVAAAAAPSTPVKSPPTTSSTTNTASKGDKKSTTSAATAATASTPKNSKAAASKTPAAAPSVPSSSSNSNNTQTKKNKANSSSTANPSGANKPSSTASAAMVMSVATRDEMVDHLLAMGFKEADCLAAISLYGTDIDKALSWLCERPANTSTESAPVATIAPSNSSGKHSTPMKQPASSSTASSSASILSSDTVPPTPTSAASSSTSAPPAVEGPNKTKEELRRINREWNARAAEDEKRKAAAAAAAAVVTPTVSSNTTAASESHPQPSSSSSHRRHHGNSNQANGHGTGGNKPYRILSNQGNHAANAAAVSSSSSAVPTSTLPAALSSSSVVSGATATGSVLSSGVGSSVAAGVIGRLPSSLTTSSPSLLGLSGGLDSMPSLTGMDGFDGSYIPIAPTLASNSSASTTESSPWTSSVAGSSGYGSSYYGSISELFPSSVIGGTASGLNALSAGTELMDTSPLLTGAIELSAEAKPFVPKFFTSAPPASSTGVDSTNPVTIPTAAETSPSLGNAILRDATSTPLNLPPPSSGAALTATPTPTLSSMLGDVTALPAFTLPAAGSTSGGLDGVTSNVFGSSLWNNPLSSGNAVNLGLGSYVSSIISTDSFHPRSSFSAEGNSSEYLSSILQGSDYLDGNEFDFDSANTVMPAVLDSLFDGSEMK